MPPQPQQNHRKCNADHCCQTKNMLEPVPAAPHRFDSHGKMAWQQKGVRLLFGGDKESKGVLFGGSFEVIQYKSVRLFS